MSGTGNIPVEERGRQPIGRANMSAGYILKCRDREQREHEDYRGVRRRVKAWGPWVGVRYGLSLHEALTDCAKRMKSGLSEWGVFHRGKRVTDDPEPRADDA